MPGPPLGREQPGLAQKNRGAPYKVLNREDRRKIMSNNQFALLANNNGNGSGIDSSPMDTATVKVKKPPPIEVFNQKISSIRALLINCKNLKCAYDFRLSVIRLENSVRESVKIYTGNNSDFALVQNHLDINKVEYTTHPLYDDKKLKICLYGLYVMDTDEIKAEITKVLKIEPIVKVITPKSVQTGDSRVYILYFKRSDKIKCSDLREKITGLFNMRVRFEYYSPRKFGPTQCANCQDFGHGSENCHRQPRCIRCGDKHTSKSCIHLPIHDDTQANPPKINNDLVKCANCGGKHTANYTRCTYRASVVNKMNHFKTSSKRPNYNFNPAEFPSLPSQPQVTGSSNNNAFTWRKDQIPPPHEATFDALQRFLDTQNNMANMMNQMFNQMSTMLSTINQMLDKLSLINNGQK